LDYLSVRYSSKQSHRTAVFPFDVQETFAPAGNDSVHFGRELAKAFTLELRRSEELGIIELFNRDRWPGKREEFFAGNYRALELARNAGYDLVFLGYLEDLRNDKDLVVYTKLIDTSNHVTIWAGRTQATSHRRSWRRDLSRTRVYQDRPDLFDFRERTEMLAHCTVNKILSSDGQ
jgi:hypothetical protein